MDARDIIIHARDLLLLASHRGLDNPLFFIEQHNEFFNTKLSLLPLLESQSKLRDITETYSRTMAEKDGLIANYAILDDFPSLSIPSPSFSTIYILSIRINDYKGNRVINIRHIVEDKTVFPIKDYIWGGQVRLTSEPVYETVKSICNLLNEISDTLVNMYVDYDNQSKTKSTSQNSFDDTKFMTLFNPSPTLRLTNNKKKQIIETIQPFIKIGKGSNQAHILNMMMDLDILVKNLSRDYPFVVSALNSIGAKIKDSHNIYRVLLSEKHFEASKETEERKRYEKEMKFLKEIRREIDFNDLRSKLASIAYNG